MSKDKRSISEKINEDEDFCYCPRLGNSIANLINKNPDGLKNDRIAKVLLTTEEEVEETFNSAIKKLQKLLKIEEE